MYGDGVKRLWGGSQPIGESPFEVTQACRTNLALVLGQNDRRFEAALPVGVV